MKNNKARYGRVEINISYVVDLNDKDMVDHATGCLIEDIHEVVKHGSCCRYIKTTEDKKLTKNDIPEFLLECN